MALQDRHIHVGFYSYFKRWELWCYTIFPLPWNTIIRYRLRAFDVAVFLRLWFGEAVFSESMSAVIKPRNEMNMCIYACNQVYMYLSWEHWYYVLFWSGMELAPEFCTTMQNCCPYILGTYADTFLSFWFF